MFYKYLKSKGDKSQGTNCQRIRKNFVKCYNLSLIHIYMLEKLRYASFDERLSVVNMLLGQLGGLFKECYVSDRYVTILYDVLRRYKEDLDLAGAIREFAETYERLRKAEQLTRQEAVSYTHLDVYKRQE